MDKYLYEASDKTGRIVKGLVEADSLDAAEDILKFNKLSILEIKPYVTFNERLNLFFKSIFARIGPRDKTVFARQLATMIGAGLPLMESLRSLTEQTPNKNLVVVIRKVITSIEKGKSFSFAISQFPNVFSPIFVSMVKSGEASGKMDTVLLDLAKQMEADYQMRSKIRGAMIYPLFILSAMFLVGMFAIVYVIPQIEEIFISAGAQLPLATNVLIKVSHFLSDFWYIAILIFIGIIVGIRYFITTTSGKYFMGYLALKIPVFSNINRGIYISHYARTLGLLIAGGVPILRSLSMVSGSVGNILIEKELKGSILDVEKGVALSTPLSQSEYFPPLVASMVKVGEETGKLDQILLNLAAIYENETNELLKGLTSLLEPIIMLIIGMGVAFLVVAILMPIFQLSQVF